MLTLVQTKDAVPLLGIYAAPKPGDKSTSMRKKQTGTVYFTHDMDPDKQNVSDASGVLHLHKTYLKKENHVNNYEFEEIAGMLDDETEPDMHPAEAPTGISGRTSTAICGARCSSGTTRTRCSS